MRFLRAAVTKGSFCSGRRSPPVITSALRYFGTEEGEKVNISSVDTADAASVGSIARDAAKIAAATRLPHNRPLFPWRHEGLDNLLPRFIPGTKEYESLLPVQPYEDLLAVVFLGESFWKTLFLRGKWKEELADGMTYAFARGVAGIVSNVYHVQLKDITESSGDYEVSFHYQPPEKVEKGKDGGATGTNAASDKNNNKEQYCPEIEYMVDRPLRKLFEAAHDSGTNQLRIQLQLKPKQAWFHRLYGVPFVTKTQIQEQPNYLQEMLLNEEGLIRPEMGKVYDILNQNAITQYLKNGKLETTLAAEVLILCDEVFCVWDVETGQVLQGSESSEPREVAHMVTFERTCQTSGSKTSWGMPIIEHLSNWQIADIDDLLEPRKWFHIYLPKKDPPHTTVTAEGKKHSNPDNSKDPTNPPQP